VDIKDVKRGRAALDPALILSELAKTSSTWRDIDVFAQVTSTNDVAIARLGNAGPDAVLAVTADEQIKGRGRLQREWSSPVGAGIALSMAIPVSRFACQVSAIPLLVGIATQVCLAKVCDSVRLKWPNDLMIISQDQSLKKFGGILVQLHGNHVVIGIGINTHLTQEELPTEFATSLSLEKVYVTREALIADIIHEVENSLQSLASDWISQYQEVSCTLLSQVNVTLANDRIVTGFAVRVLTSGALVLETLEGEIEVTSGDVVQVRSQPN